MTLTTRLSMLLGVSLFLSFFSWGRRILFPFQIFTTWIHECCHAIVATLLGASSVQITLSPDGSGLTQYKIQKGRFRQGIISCAGYLGSSISGCLIFCLAIGTEKLPHYWNTHSMVIFLCVLIGLSMLFWIRNFFGLISALLLGTGIASLNFSPMNQFSHEILLFISIQTALNALFDIRTLFSIGSSKKVMSDAHTMEKLFFLPSWFWAISWLSMSMLLMYYTVQYML